MKENTEIEVKDLVLIKDDFDKAIEYFKSILLKRELDKEFMFKCTLNYSLNYKYFLLIIQLNIQEQIKQIN